MNINPWKKKSTLDEQIDDVHSQLEAEEVNSEEFEKLMAVLERLYKIKENQKSDRVDAATKATIAGNLLGIVLILHHERVHVISTKALGFVTKNKI